MSKEEVNMTSTALSLLEFLGEKRTPVAIGLGSLAMALVMAAKQLGLDKEAVLEAVQRTADTVYDDPMWQETMQ